MPQQRSTTTGIPPPSGRQPASPTATDTRNSLRRRIKWIRVPAATGALMGTLALGVIARPALPALGLAREGPAVLEAKVPLGWRRVGGGADRVSYSNGLTGGFRSSATHRPGGASHAGARAVAGV